MRSRKCRLKCERLEQRQLLTASVWFEDSGQDLGTNTAGLALGDLDGDGVGRLYRLPKWPRWRVLFRNKSLAKRWSRTVHGGMECPVVEHWGSGLR
jgi:hypothetical protein